MIAELKAVKALLPWPTRIADAGNLLPPYAIVWSPPGGRSDDEAYAGLDDDYTARLGVTLVAATATEALEMAEQAIGILTPRRRARRLESEHRDAWIRYREARDVQIDRQVTLPATNTNPAFVAVLFDVRSEPKEA